MINNNDNNKVNEVRTRFAPSPTGYMHVGNLRTALFAFLLAKANNGKFILRIEDTDQERQVEGAIEVIYKTLKKTGIIWDEGPDIGGEYGPYIQSERKGMYMEYALQLLNNKKAFYCFCDKDRLDKVRKDCEEKGITPHYDGLCRHLTENEIKQNLKENKSFVVRQWSPDEGETTFSDKVYGEITVDNTMLDDIILIKSDGMPTYNFANVIDDHTMGITHIIRGSEYLSSTPKYNLIYQSFGWDIPTYIHVSPVMRTKESKLSKRDGDASYSDYIEKGFLTEAIINYIALLGWSPGDDREKFTLNELIEVFNIKGISKSPAIFDETKLKWLNGEYIRELPFESYYKMAKPWLKQFISAEEINLEKIAKLMHPRTEIFSTIHEKLDFFNKIPEYEIELYTHKKMKTNPENALQSLNMVLEPLEKTDTWTNENLFHVLVETAKANEVNKKKILWSVRIAISGKLSTPGGGTEIAEILGKEESLKRIKAGVSLLQNALNS